MTGPEQHAATVRAALTAIDFRLSTTHSTQSANAALDELVALAGRAQEDADGSRFLRGLADASSDNWRARAEAAEARADELQRERDEALAALDECGKTLLSQTEAFETHLGRQVATEEEKCSTAARGSEDTPSTPATAPADAPSSATEASSTSTPKADAHTESAGKGTPVSPATSGSDGSAAELEQARREADQLRAALEWLRHATGWEAFRPIRNTNEWRDFTARLDAALAGVQAEEEA